MIIDRAKFMARVQKTATCWLWTGFILPNGYGQFYPTRTEKIGAHRASWILHRGPIPEGIQCLHTCDVRRCVRPSHLYLGTGKDNMYDRRVRGPQTCTQKLTYAKVAEIRAAYRTWPVRVLAGMFPQVKRAALYNIVKHVTWKVKGA